MSQDNGLTEVNYNKYNKISHLGNPNGDHIRLIEADRWVEVKFTVKFNKGRKFQEIDWLVTA